MSEWQPIETAPKDRPIILAAKWFFTENWEIIIDQWLATRWPFVAGDQPSHWMPLPDPPGVGEALRRSKR